MSKPIIRPPSVAVSRSSNISFNIQLIIFLLALTGAIIAYIVIPKDSSSFPDDISITFPKFSDPSSFPIPEDFDGWAALLQGLVNQLQKLYDKIAEGGTLTEAELEIYTKIRDQLTKILVMYGNGTLELPGAILEILTEALTLEATINSEIGPDTPTNLN